MLNPPFLTVDFTMYKYYIHFKLCTCYIHYIHFVYSVFNFILYAAKIFTFLKPDLLEQQNCYII